MKKLYALNNCLLYYVKRTYRRKDGLLYQPNYYNFRLKSLFSTFNLKGIEYQRGKHFNFSNGFANFLQREWNQRLEDNPSYGCRPTKHEPAEDLEEQVRRAVLVDELLDYKRDILAQQMLFLFGCGTYLLFRGVDVSIWCVKVCFLLLFLFTKCYD